MHRNCDWSLGAHTLPSPVASTAAGADEHIEFWLRQIQYRSDKVLHFFAKQISRDLVVENNCHLQYKQFSTIAIPPRSSCEQRYKLERYTR